MLNYLKIKKNSVFFAFLMLFTVIFFGCEDVFEDDISDKSIRLLSPSDNIITTTNTIFFSWETLEGADKYNFQIVTNNFNNPGQYICDSNITTNFITYTLPQGNYQWRVRGVNFGYNTVYTTRTFTVSLSPDITGQIPQLISPVYGDTTNAISFLFKWNSISYVVDYRFELWEGAVNTGTKIFSAIVDTNIINYTLPHEGYYVWQLRGQNNSSNTPFSMNPLLCDTTAPMLPVITNPLNNTTVTDSTVNFTWLRTNQPGSVEFDSVFVYSDSLMLNLVKVAKVYNKSYSTIIYNGKYWWNVKPYDRAGNHGTSTGLSKFTIAY